MIGYLITAALVAVTIVLQGAAMLLLIAGGMADGAGKNNSTWLIGWGIIFAACGLVLAWIT